ncbi:MerR family transcriptional regulator [Actinophytocola sp.]|uniref:MerR family transcriptional regulator n=1 Tax=Actinophytocola sp. TaxID=1872138 RepID=UPI003899D085
MLERGDRTPVADARVYTAGQVARALGVPEPTLRSWHRRYGVGPRAPRPGGYRRYTAEDIVRLENMRDLIRSGMLASDAARRVDGEVPTAALDEVRERLAAASHRLDSPACRAIVLEAVRTFGVVPVWERLCRPAMHDVEAEQAARAGDEACVPREHVISWAVAAALHQVAPLAPDGRPAVMLACADGEQHSLPLEALAAALAERHVPVRMLGAAVPLAGLVDAVRATSPRVVVLWSQRADTANPEALRRLRRFPSRLMTAGPGWPARRRGSAEHLDNLTDALATLTTLA